MLVQYSQIPRLKLLTLYSAIGHILQLARMLLCYFMPAEKRILIFSHISTNAASGFFITLLQVCRFFVAFLEKMCYIIYKQ